MPKRIVKGPIHLRRGGKVVIPRKGEVFNFTDAELKTINALNPKAIEHIIIADAPAPAPADTGSSD